jgi:hypothetical protein
VVWHRNCSVSCAVTSIRGLRVSATENEMGDKSRRPGIPHALRDAQELEGRSKQICSDLESRGVSRELSLPAARRLSPIAAGLSPKEYAAVLDGVVAAYVDPDEVQAAGDIGEIQRLMEGFSRELRKLEEGLQILSAYVARMGSRSNPERRTTLH